MEAAAARGPALCGSGLGLHGCRLPCLTFDLQTLALHEAANLRITEAGRVYLATLDELPDLGIFNPAALCELRNCEQLAGCLCIAQDALQEAQLVLVGEQRLEVRLAARAV